MEARDRVEFAIFTFAKSSGIDDQLVLAKEAGIKVRGALFRSQANQKWSAKDTLKDAGVKFHLVPRIGLRGIKPRKLHHKLMVIDERLIIVGSFNYTGPANQLNDENIMVIGNLAEDNPSSKQKQERLAGYALEEIDRIINSFG
jgi:phosphatidylserine/phosphatidylglycerophosphate/cardiolipin synthase-like enzyme